MDNTIIIKWQKNNYFIKYIKSKKIYELYKTNNFNKACNYIGKVGKENIPLGKWNKKLSNVTKVVFFDSFINKTAINSIKNFNPNIKVIVYFWNKIDENNKEVLKFENVDSFYTFDFEDMKKYKINYNAQFYSKDLKIKNKNAKYDICFLGRDKERKSVIEKLQKQFNKNKLTYDIKIIHDEKDFISYKKYLKMIENSKCILEILSNNQKGASLRTMEALFFRKKLITDNKNIIKYDFYNSKNVFIIGKDDIKKLNEFINSDYCEIDESIINYYDFENWIKRFN